MLLFALMAASAINESCSAVRLMCLTLPGVRNVSFPMPACSGDGWAAR